MEEFKEHLRVKDTVVVDIHFASNAEQRQALGRLEVYKKKKGGR